jgi:hypothetical protein
MGNDTYTDAGADQYLALSILQSMPCTYSTPGALALSGDYEPGVYCI